jgi:hypothetical protein
VIKISNKRRSFPLKTVERAELMSVTELLSDRAGTPRLATLGFRTAIAGIPGGPEHKKLIIE